jgi:hypothetical protein
MTTYTPEQRAAMIAALREDWTQGHHHETVSLPDRAASLPSAPWSKEAEMMEAWAAPSASLAAENAALRAALAEYARAGVGNSTDWSIQLSALRLATEAIKGGA